jgi:beta-glucosidase-like glycosyl hydrolase
LGLPAYDWGGNCIHGVQSRCTESGLCPTSFPNPIGLGAAFNRSVWHGMGAVIGMELRYMYLAQVGEDHASNLPAIGLDCWSPNIGIVREPRWGRNLETPGEDPLVNGAFGAAVTEGLQRGTLDQRFLQAVVTLKHFDANSLEGNWGPGGKITRHTVNAEISAYDLHSTYLPAFKTAVVDGKAKGVMCSYNAVNGVPSCANKFLLTSTLRDAWGFDGYVSSDSGAVKDIIDSHHYTSDWNHTVAAAIDAGCDMQSASWPAGHPWGTGGQFIDYLPGAVRGGFLKESALDDALRHVLSLRFELGLFDPIDDQPYWKLPESTVRSAAHVDRAVDATKQSLVLLKNENNALPFAAGKKVAVVGPHANNRASILGNYLGEICPDDTYDCVQTPFEAIAALNNASGGTTTSADGCDVNSTSTSKMQAAIDAAMDADYIVFFGGLDGTIEREGHDRHDIGLPGMQPVLLGKLVDISEQQGKPLAVVLYHGGIVVLGKTLLGGVPSLISAGYPSFYGAAAMASALFDAPGQANKAPSRFGNTPVTWYSEDGWADAAFDMLNFSMTNGPGRTYRYYDSEGKEGGVDFPFGHGLQYAAFEVSEAAVAKVGGGSVALGWTLTNTGDRASDNVAFCYVTGRDIPAGEPAGAVVKTLVDFQRVSVGKGASADVRFSVGPGDLTMHAADGKEVFFPGRYTVEVVLTSDATETVQIQCTEKQCVKA